MYVAYEARAAKGGTERIERERERETRSSNELPDRKKLHERTEASTQGKKGKRNVDVNNQREKGRRVCRQPLAGPWDSLYRYITVSLPFPFALLFMRAGLCGLPPVSWGLQAALREESAQPAKTKVSCLKCRAEADRKSCEKVRYPY